VVTLETVSNGDDRVVLTVTVVTTTVVTLAEAVSDNNSDDRGDSDSNRGQRH
jgi:hypothetical protein